MALWEWLGSIGAAIFTIYVFLTTNNKGRFAVFVFAVVLILGEMYSRYTLDMSAVEYAPRKVRYCRAGDDFLRCILSADYERSVILTLGGRPSPATCDLCPVRQIPVPVERIRYVNLQESNLARRDVERLTALVGMPFTRSRFLLGRLAGVRDISSAASEGGTAGPQGQFHQYAVPIRVDNVLPELINYRSGCVSNAQLIVLVSGDTIIEIDWVGGIEKRCFDLLWLPVLGRLYDFRIDEQFRPRRVIDTAIRSYDDGPRKLLIVTSRSPKPDQRNVGVRLAVISSAHITLPWPLPEWTYGAFFRQTEDFANQ